MVRIREFQARDAQAVSDLIRVTMRRSNAEDYSPETLQPLMDYFSASKIAQLAVERYCLVAEYQNALVGTAAMEGGQIHTFFVHPDHQGNGIGSRLLAALEAAASALGINRLWVESSLTGVRFYDRNGYRRTGRTRVGAAGSQVEMEKSLDNVQGLPG